MPDDEPKERDSWEQALELSRRFRTERILDPTDGALQYHATHVQPRWTRSFIGINRIGRHLFYKPRGSDPGSRHPRAGLVMGISNQDEPEEFSQQLDGDDRLDAAVDWARAAEMGLRIDDNASAHPE